MPTSFTYTATLSSAPSAAATDYNWTVNTLGAHEFGEVNQEHNADGTAPARFKRVARAAGIDLWISHDWHCRRRIGTLTCTADQAYAALPTDFAELDARLLRELADDADDTWQKIRFTADLAEFLSYKNRYGADDSATPLIGYITQDTSASTFTWRVEFAPTPDKGYTYRLPYLVRDPWTCAIDGGSVLGDGNAPIWPVPFFRGWRMHAHWQLLQSYRSNDDWKDARGDYQAWLLHQQQENDKPHSTDPNRVAIGYDDFGLREAADWPSDW